LAVVNRLPDITNGAKTALFRRSLTLSRGVTLIALDVPYMNDFRRMSDANTARMVTDIVSALMEHLAADSRAKASERIIRGLVAARENGVALGRQRANLPDGFAESYETFLGGGCGSISRAAFAETLGIGRSTLYKYIGLYNESRDNNG
jgi:DNA invertase Pin-like site-specific DNA recombinase